MKMNLKSYLICSLFGSLLLLVNSEEHKTQPSNVWLHNPPDILSILFQGYAEDDTGLSHSALERLVNCSLGIVNCSHPKSYQNPEFHSFINCKTNPTLSGELCHFLHNCVSGDSILSSLNLYNSSSDKISKDHFKELLPAILYQAQSQLCDKGQHYSLDLTSAPSLSPSKPSSLEVWGYGFLFVTLISGCSLLGVSVIPFMNGQFYQRLLTTLIGLAVGSLAASSLFHLIPQAFRIPEAYGNHDYLFLSLGVLVGIWFFFMVERFLKIIFSSKHRSSTMTNSMSSQPIIPESSPNSKFKGNSSEICLSCGRVAQNSIVNNIGGATTEFEDNHDLKQENNVTPNKVKQIFASQEQAIKASFGHEQKPEVDGTQEISFLPGKDSVIETVAWMIIFGDGFHNFIDGVSIGAAFQQSTLTGISISLAVMCEELPHELGDFAVLLNSGMTMKQAMFYNFLSASVCYVGMAIGILLGEFTENSTYIFALAAGMFLYISLVDMVPEMNETAAKAAEVGIKDALYILLLQNLGMILGVLSLFLLAYYQESISLG